MSSAIRSGAGKAIESVVATRSMFVKVKPIPATLSQRRAVLKALQRYGDIEVFKKLANEASFISVAATSETARKLIYSSPMDVQFVDEPFDGLSQGTSLFSSSQPGVAPQINPIVNPNITSSIDNKYGNKATHFTVHVFPNEGYRHKTVIRYSPLYGPWPKEDAAKETFVYAALDKVVPKNIMAREAFCDWRTGGQLSDDARNMRNQSQNGKLAYIQERKMRRKKSIAATAGEPIILTELKSLRQPKADTTPAADKKEDE